jgi:ribosomal protein S18 acetylase RimI-like enzyme
MTFAIRRGGPGDYPVFVRLFPELGVDDPILSPEQFAARVLPGVLVVEDNGAPVGYACWRLYGDTAHVVNVVVDPAARSRGAGRALIEAVRGRVLAEGARRWYLNTKQDNVVAISLYEKSGFSIEFESWPMVTAWSHLASLTADDAEVFVPAPADDAELAASVGLDSGLLALMRSRPGVHLAGLREQQRAIAFAAFDPAYPGVYPIRVPRPALARRLLDALGRHAKEDRVMILVEGDASLRDALASVGAVVSYPMYRLSASLG